MTYEPDGKSRGTWEPSSRDFFGLEKKGKTEIYGHHIDIGPILEIF